MVDASIEETKARLRERARLRRAGLDAADRADAAAAAAGWFFSEVPLSQGAIVAAYWALRDEMDCQPILLRLVQSGQPVCLPAVAGSDRPLAMRLWEPGSALYPSGFGTLAPSELAPEVVPDLVIMPLLAFDRLGTRLGYGGGYYDRTLRALPQRPRLVGLAFSAQELEFIPRDEHDVPLDALVTELGVRTFGKAI